MCVFRHAWGTSDLLIFSILLKLSNQHTQVGLTSSQASVVKGNANTMVTRKKNMGTSQFKFTDVSSNYHCNPCSFSSHVPFVYNDWAKYIVCALGFRYLVTGVPFPNLFRCL